MDIIAAILFIFVLVLCFLLSSDTRDDIKHSRWGSLISGFVMIGGLFWVGYGFSILRDKWKIAQHDQVISFLFIQYKPVLYMFLGVILIAVSIYLQKKEDKKEESIIQKKISEEAAKKKSE